MDRLYGGLVAARRSGVRYRAHVGDPVGLVPAGSGAGRRRRAAPALVKLLRLFYGRRADVAIEAVAIAVVSARRT